jgi:hypothetical protein
MLPPTPAAVAAYFAQRRGSLAGFTPDEVRNNERLWLVEVCGLSEPPESEARAPAPAREGRALEAEDGGSMEPEVVPAIHAANSHCGACGQPFQPRREWSRYCTVNCKQRAKRARRVGA